MTTQRIRLERTGRTPSTKEKRRCGVSLLAFAMVLPTLVGLAQVPRIDQVTPRSGPPGSLVTLSGQNFDLVAGNNLVRFGGMRAEVVSATSGSLVVRTPGGATHAPVSVTLPSGLGGSSSAFFLPTFAGAAMPAADSFVPAAPLALAGGANRVATIGDLDDDGRPDLVVGNSVSSLSVFLNQTEAGTLEWSQRIEVISGSPVLPFFGDSYNVAMNDLDGDGRLDLVVATTAGYVVIHRNASVPGTLLLDPPIYLQTPGLSTMVDCGDLDGDGRPEIVVGNTIFDSVTIFPNLSSVGTLNFGDGIPEPTDEYVQCVRIVDLNGDGRPEIAAANRRYSLPSTVSVLRNLSSPGSFQFQKVDPSFAQGGESAMLEVLDVDRDGKLDLAVGNVAAGKVTVLQNTSAWDISFAPPVNLLPDDPSSPFLAVGDLNGDGRADLVVGDDVNGRAGQPTVSLIINQVVDLVSSSSFAAPVRIPMQGCTFWTSVGDLDGDGRPDLVAVDECTQQLIPLLNRTPVAPPTLVCPTDLVLTLPPGQCSMSVNFEVPSTIGGVPPVAVSCVPASGSVFEVGSTVVHCTATDADGGLSLCEFSVTVLDAESPVVESITAPSEPQVLGRVIEASAVVYENCTLATAIWNWGDGTASEVAATSGTVTGTHLYAAPGVYRVELLVRDLAGNEGVGRFEYVVVYQPMGGFITGGGWIRSPEGSGGAHLECGGRASFGFVARYQRGEPEPRGHLNFTLRSDDWHFESATLQWLVISGGTAQLRGQGRLNHSRQCGFQLTIGDQQSVGGVVADRLRLRIWDAVSGTVIYDNQPGLAANAAATMAISGGNIVVHRDP